MIIYYHNFSSIGFTCNLHSAIFKHIIFFQYRSERTIWQLILVTGGWHFENRETTWYITNSILYRAWDMIESDHATGLTPLRIYVTHWKFTTVSYVQLFCKSLFVEQRFESLMLLSENRRRWNLHCILKVCVPVKTIAN